MSFSQPVAQSSSDFKIKDYPGHLMLIYPREYRVAMPTINGAADVIVADVVVLTDPNGPRAEAGALIFQKVLVGTLKNNINGNPVLGRLGRGTAKPGQTAPYILEPFADADAAYATSYLQSVGGNPFPAPAAFAAPTPAPAPVPVQQAPVPVALPAPVAAPVPVPVAAAYPAPAPTPAAAPLPQAPGALTPEAAQAMAALGMSAPPVPTH